MIRDGYIRVAQQAHKVSTKELIEIDAYLYELGFNLGDFEEWYKEQGFTLRRHTSMKTLRETYNRGIDAAIAVKKKVNRLCIFIKGEPNSGKSYTSLLALQAMGYSRIHSIDNSGTGKFDDLLPTTQAIIIDDQTAPSLLNLCDNKIVKAYRRGSGDRYFTGDIVVVTSNFEFEEWIKACKEAQTPKQLEAMIDRFYICGLSPDGKLKCNTPSPRGMDEDQLERLEKFIDFKSHYDELIGGYKKGNLKEFYDLLTDGTDKSFEKLKNMVKYCEVGMPNHPIIHDDMYCEVGPTVKHTEVMDDAIAKAISDILTAQPETFIMPEACKGTPEEGKIWLKIPMSQKLFREVSKLEGVKPIVVEEYKGKKTAVSTEDEDTYESDTEEGSTS